MNARNENDSEKEFPRAILHIDGDAFFVSCELTRKPWLRGRPVVTGAERGIASAMSPEAKACGITRGMRISDMRRLCPGLIILSSDYDMYALYARRMYMIVRRYANQIEEYSIDECFADLTGQDVRRGISYQAIAAEIQQELRESLGMTFSVGLGVNKVTAKIASKWKKPAGLTVISRGLIPEFLAQLPIGKVWGVGGATSLAMGKLGIVMAGDLAGKSRAWVAEHCDKPVAEIWQEFQGDFTKQFETSREPVSVQRTRTFRPATNDRAFLWSQISHHAEDASARIRQDGLVALRASFFLKTTEFQYLRAEVELPDPTAEPDQILRAVWPAFEKMWKRISGASKNGTSKFGAGMSGGVLFRASGISLTGLRPRELAVETLFGEAPRVKNSRIIHQTIDRLAERFGRHSVFLGSSFNALSREDELSVAAKRRPFNVIFLGQVK